MSVHSAHTSARAKAHTSVRPRPDQARLEIEAQIEAGHEAEREALCARARRAEHHAETAEQRMREAWTWWPGWPGGARGEGLDSADFGAMLAPLQRPGNAGNRANYSRHDAFMDHLADRRMVHLPLGAGSGAPTREQRSGDAATARHFVSESVTEPAPGKNNHAQRHVPTRRAFAF